MNKTQLVATLSEELGSEEWPKKDVKEFLDTFERVVTESCSKGEPVMLTGFVKFARQDRKARNGRNPATGESIKIPAKSVAKATALKRFRDTVMEAAPKQSKGRKKGKK